MIGLGTSITPGTASNAARLLTDLFLDLSGLAGLGSYHKTTANTGSLALNAVGELTSAVCAKSCRGRHFFNEPLVPSWYKAAA